MRAISRFIDCMLARILTSIFISLISMQYIYVGYGNVGSYIPKICPNNACNEWQLHIFPFFKGVLLFLSGI
jgi:hypothetical protein